MSVVEECRYAAMSVDLLARPKTFILSLPDSGGLLPPTPPTLYKHCLEAITQKPLSKLCTGGGKNLKESHKFTKTTNCQIIGRAAPFKSSSSPWTGLPFVWLGGPANLCFCPDLHKFQPKFYRKCASYARWKKVRRSFKACPYRPPFSWLFACLFKS